jgi:hypothetical protein
MFTSIDKALVALVMAVLFLLNYFLGVNFPPNVQDIVTVAISVLTPILVHQIPNRSKT